MTKKLLTLEDAKRILGKNSEKMTDKEITDLLRTLRFLCSKIIDQIMEKK